MELLTGRDNDVWTGLIQDLDTCQTVSDCLRMAGVSERYTLNIYIVQGDIFSLPYLLIHKETSNLLSTHRTRDILTHCDTECYMGPHKSSTYVPLSGSTQSNWSEDGQGHTVTVTLDKTVSTNYSHF